MKMMTIGKIFALQVDGLPRLMGTDPEGAGGMPFRRQLRRKISAITSSEIEMQEAVSK